jgi:Flp pilus assembly protein TadG
MKLLRDESGQVMAMTVVSMIFLVGALGLAVDVGVLFRARRTMQTAADAAAMAGATEMYYNGATGVNTQAYAAAAANGVDHNVSGNNVIVTPSPSLGGTACPSCVEVQLSTPNPTIFMATMSHLLYKSSSYDSINVSAMAVAGAPGASQTCMYVMKPTGPDTLHLHGAGDINAANCVIYVNSSDPNALCVTGNAGKSTFSNLEVVGGQDGGGSCKGDPGPPVNTGSGVQSPKIGSNMPADPTKSCNAGNTMNLASLSGDLRAQAQTPGYGNYECFTNQSCTTKKGVTTCTNSPVDLGGGTTTQLGPGVYVFETGVTVSGSVTVGTGNNSKTDPQTASNGGATIVVTGTGAFDSSTATNFSVWAPADSLSNYNAVAIYQPLSDTSDMMLQFGSSSSYFNGAVYAPSAFVTLHDQGGAVNATDLIVGSIYVNGTVNLTNYSNYNPITTPFKVITLVD